MPKITERIISEADLQKEITTALRNAQNEPLIITQDGRPTAYLVSVDLFDALLERLAQLDDMELRGAVGQAEAEFESVAFNTLEEAQQIVEALWQSKANSEGTRSCFPKQGISCLVQVIRFTSSKPSHHDVGPSFE